MGSTPKRPDQSNSKRLLICSESSPKVAPFLNKWFVKIFGFVQLLAYLMDHNMFNCVKIP